MEDEKIHAQHVHNLDLVIGAYLEALAKNSGLPSASQYVGSLLIQTGLGLIKDFTSIDDKTILHGFQRMLAIPRDTPQEINKKANEIIKHRAPH